MACPVWRLQPNSDSPAIVVVQVYQQGMCLDMSEDLQQQVAQQLKYIQNQRKQLDDLRARVTKLETLFEMSVADPQIRWLLENKSERMDPTVPIFDQGRADFHLDRYLFASKYVAGKVVADIASGTGYGSRTLADQGQALSVTGVDICNEAVDYATIRHGGQNVKFLCASGDATGLPDASFDVIASFETIEHVDDDSKLLSEFARLLKADGLLICSTPNLWPLAIAPHHVREYDRAAFEAVLNQHFEIIEMFNQNSGTAFEFNRQQGRGIIPTNAENESLAECFLAVCRKS